MRGETKEQRFKRIAEKRVQRVLDSLRSLSQCSNKRMYEWDSKQMQKIWAVIEKSLLNPEHGLKMHGRRNFVYRAKEKRNLMKLLQKIPFDFENKQYEIRILFGDNTVNFAAFSNNYPANGFRRHIKLTKNSMPEKVLESQIFSDMVNEVKNDIIEKRWETFISGLN